MGSKSGLPESILAFVLLYIPFCHGKVTGEGCASPGGTLNLQEENCPLVGLESLTIAVQQPVQLLWGERSPDHPSSVVQLLLGAPVGPGAPERRGTFGSSSACLAAVLPHQRACQPLWHQRVAAVGLHLSSYVLSPREPPPTAFACFLPSPILSACVGQA